MAVGGFILAVFNFTRLLSSCCSILLRWASTLSDSQEKWSQFCSLQYCALLKCFYPPGDERQLLDLWTPAMWHLWARYNCWLKLLPTAHGGSCTQGTTLSLVMRSNIWPGKYVLRGIATSCANVLKCPGMNEKAQWVKALATKPADLSSVPGTRVVEGGNQLLQVIFWSPH